MSEETEARLTGRRVIIVDDDREVLEGIEQALAAEGADTSGCSDGDEATRACEAQPPDAVVLDMMLPKRSGFLVLDKVKRLENPPVVIMVTGNEGKRHQQYAEALGVDGYMHKPVRLERLVTMIQELLEERTGT
jgi:DNA-binding response OmpR family regulator